ncbi:hypothetical protein [Brevibacillus nitrificans]|uniref:hypothetical protein n=1 Tax=Brevibacillus nitrificans TaxID=651560 RepID=UPI00285B9635|nr:hypothetical protein [Brevibacillus nitrificans]MDR7316054.1 hypothetical protein [Brevibacillus nitrificans]
MSNQTLADMLKQDPFETNEEFQERINKIKVLAGTGQLLKEFYDIESGIFPVAVSWEPSVEKCLREYLPVGTINILKPSIPKTYFVAPREQAKSLYEANPQYPVIAALQYEQNHGLAIVKELLLQISSNEAIKILTYDKKTVISTVNTILKRLTPSANWKREIDGILYNPSEIWTKICQEIIEKSLLSGGDLYNKLLVETHSKQVTSSAITIVINNHTTLTWYRDNYASISYAIELVTGKRYVLELRTY